MGINKKIRVLVVDDSIVFREMLCKGLSTEPSIEIVAKAGNPFEARDMIIEYEPDVMTLDVEMPMMRGTEFLKKLMPQYPIPVVVISSKPENVFDALNSGAVDFAAKPGTTGLTGIDMFIKEIAVKIKIASVAKVKCTQSGIQTVKRRSSSTSGGKYSLIAIGASTGGTEALHDVIKNFDRTIPGIVVVQHMPPVFTRMYAERLNRTCDVEVLEAKDNDEVFQGRVLIAPGDRHMVLNRVGDKFFVRLQSGDRVNGHCPSVDVLFNSVAEKAADITVGVILTGMGHDGARGLLAMRKKGSYTIGQDEETSVVYGMPKVAYDIGGVQKQLPIQMISDTIIRVLDGK